MQHLHALVIYSPDLHHMHAPTHMHDTHHTCIIWYNIRNSQHTGIICLHPLIHVILTIHTLGRAHCDMRDTNHTCIICAHLLIYTFLKIHASSVIYGIITIYVLTARNSSCTWYSTYMHYQRAPFIYVILTIHTSHARTPWYTWYSP